MTHQMLEHHFQELNQNFFNKFEDLSVSEHDTKILDIIREAHWYYVDNLIDVRSRDFGPSKFVDSILAYTDSTKIHEVLDNFPTRWKEYETIRSTWKRAGLMLVDESTECVLVVKGFESNVYTFPVGKVENGEEDRDAAKREVHEEIGQVFEIPENAPCLTKEGGQNYETTVFIIFNVDMRKYFEPARRDEIEEIAWVK